MSDATDKVMETRVKGMEDSVKMSMSFFEKSVAGLATRDTVGAVEKTLKGEVGEKTAALEKTLTAQMGAMETTLTAQMGAMETTLTAQMGAMEKNIIGKLDTMNTVVWRFTGVIILTALLAPNIRDMWTAPKKPE